MQTIDDEKLTQEEACYLLGQAAAGKLEMSHSLIDQAEELGAVIPLGHRHGCWVVEQRAAKAPVGGFGFTSRSCAWAFWAGLGDEDGQFELRMLVDPRREAQLIFEKAPELKHALGFGGKPKLQLVRGGKYDEQRSDALPAVARR